MKSKKIILISMIALIAICIIFIYVKANQNTDSENMPQVFIQYFTDKDVNERKGLYLCGYSWMVDGSLEIEPNDVNRSSIQEIELKKGTKASLATLYSEIPSLQVKEFRPEDISDYEKGTIISDSLEPITCHSGYTYAIELFFEKDKKVMFAFKCK